MENKEPISSAELLRQAQELRKKSERLKKEADKNNKTTRLYVTVRIRKATKKQSECQRAELERVRKARDEGKK